MCVCGGGGGSEGVVAFDVISYLDLEISCV